MPRVEMILLICLSISFVSSHEAAVSSNLNNVLVVNVAPPEISAEPSGYHETGFIMEDDDEAEAAFVEDYHAAHYDKVLPKNFDLRTVWNKDCLWLRQISDQGACGSCWAVSTADVIRDRLCMAYEDKWGYLASAAEFMNCVNQSAHDACQGSHPHRALKYFVKTGIVTGGPYHFSNTCKPYPIPPIIPPRSILPSYCPAKCTDPDYEGTYEGDNVRGKNVRRFKGKNVVKDIQLEIFLNGPVVAGFDVYPSFKIFWHTKPSDAVYKKEDGEEKKSRHAIRIVGWGVTEDKTDYWIILNSWGNDTLRHGEGRFLRGSNECRFEENVYGVDV